MQRAVLYVIFGTIISFLVNYFLIENASWEINLYYAAAFGLGWGMAYFVDHPEWPLPKKMGISFIGIILLLVIGMIGFDFVLAIPSIIRFSTVFVAYYLIASFRETKSLRL